MPINNYCQACCTRMNMKKNKIFLEQNLTEKTINAFIS